MKKAIVKDTADFHGLPQISKDEAVERRDPRAGEPNILISYEVVIQFAASFFLLS